MIVDEHLCFKHHLQPYIDQGQIGKGAKSDRHWHHQAQYLHALSVCQGTQDFLTQELMQITGPTDSDKFYYFMIFGVARRYKSILTCLRTVISTIPPQRDEPMVAREVEEISRLLNLTYIDIRGVQDNFAWALAHLIGGKFVSEIRPSRFNLFCKEFTDLEPFAFLNDLKDHCAEWNATMKTMRDPIAHRIPLSIPPAFLNKKDQLERKNLERQWGEASANVISLLQNEATSEKVSIAEAEQERLYIALQKVGKFSPNFGHDPSIGFKPIYPTLPEDLGMLLMLSRSICSKIPELRTALI